MTSGSCPMGRQGAQRCPVGGGGHKKFEHGQWAYLNNDDEMKMKRMQIKFHPRGKLVTFG